MALREGGKRAKPQAGISDYYRQSRITFKREVISSAEINSPLPEPGHTVQACCQFSGVATLLSQNGHVLHSGGRTGHTVHPCSRSHKTQSPLVFSRSASQPSPLAAAK